MVLAYYASVVLGVMVILYGASIINATPPSADVAQYHEVHNAR